jgi:hypothetical protein
MTPLILVLLALSPQAKLSPPVTIYVTAPEIEADRAHGLITAKVPPDVEQARSQISHHAGGVGRELDLAATPTDAAVTLLCEGLSSRTVAGAFGGSLTEWTVTATLIVGDYRRPFRASAGDSRLAITQLLKDVIAFLRANRQILTLTNR